MAVRGTGERPTAEASESPRCRQLRGLGVNPDLVEVKAGGARAPVPNEPPEGNDEFARELASTMSAIASLVIKASGRSVSNGGWLYFNGASGEYCPFKTKCRLFQETYHKVTPPKPLVNMFREWNLAEEVACHIKGAEDMPTAWRMLDTVYDDTPARTMDQTLKLEGRPSSKRKGARRNRKQELPVRSNPHCCRQEKRPHLGLWTPKSPGQRLKLRMARKRSMSSSTRCTG